MAELSELIDFIEGEQRIAELNGRTYEFEMFEEVAEQLYRLEDLEH